MPALRIGIDFDNTIAGYDRVFRNLARDSGLVDTAIYQTKSAIRDRVRELDDGDMKWQQLQGQGYGARMQDAELIDGVGDFLQVCRQKNIVVQIISHKTEYGHFDPERVNLRDAARRWMQSKGFFDKDRHGFGLSPENVHFETTRADKVARIGACCCSIFIDDLPEVFLEPAFPEETTRYLFAPSGAADGPYKIMPSWQHITDAIFTPGV